MPVFDGIINLIRQLYEMVVEIIVDNQNVVLGIIFVLGVLFGVRGYVVSSRSRRIADKLKDLIGRLAVNQPISIKDALSQLADLFKSSEMDEREKIMVVSEAVKVLSQFTDHRHNKELTAKDTERVFNEKLLSVLGGKSVDENIQKRIESLSKAMASIAYPLYYHTIPDELNLDRVIELIGHLQETQS